jgi:hypothetical protein
MKKQIARMFVFISLLLIITGAALTASAQTAQRVVIYVPFEFTAGEERLPAGRYTIARVSENSEKAYLVRAVNGRATATVLTHSINNGRASRAAKLAFTRYGDRYFLAEVWTPEMVAGRAVPKSKSEKELRRELQQRAAEGDAEAREAAEGKTVVVNGLLR